MHLPSMRTLVWYRGKDLRVADHAPLHAAITQGEVICLFVLDPYFFAPDRAAQLPHRMQFLLESLTALQANLKHLGTRLIVVEGSSIEVVPKVAHEWRIDQVVAHRWCEPFGRERDRRIAQALHVPLKLFEGETLAPLGVLRNGSGTPYAVFTPFSKAHRKTFGIDLPIPAPKQIPPLPHDFPNPPQVGRSLKVPDGGRENEQFSDIGQLRVPTLAELGINHNPHLLMGGERAARTRLAEFIGGAASRYEVQRNRMDLEGTSRLSADLKFGTLSVRTVWHAAKQALAIEHPSAWLSYSNELLWREFAHNVLWENPGLLKQPHRKEYEAFPWLDDAQGWHAWVTGTTGFPVVDASARQLLAEGFVHNRARMISASFLTKDLMIDYRRGEAHYLRYLTDGDWAQNNAGWQWTAGCGFDAQPYFRVFNPTEQGKKFDPSGAYVRRWVPELRDLPIEFLHDPSTAPSNVLKKANLELRIHGTWDARNGEFGRNYPFPIVKHAECRNRFLIAASTLVKPIPSPKPTNG